MRESESEGYLTKKGAADYLSLSTRTLENLVARGELAAFRPIVSGGHNRKVLFRKADLKAWVERFRVGVDLDRIVSETLTELGAGK